MNDWLHITRSDSPLILTFPHGGTSFGQAKGLIAERALIDADWHIRALYDGLADATLIWTDVSRSVIDCNRDPSGVSLYPGQATTELCPTVTFDGLPLYRDDLEPSQSDIASRRALWFDPYHAAIATEITRLQALHDCVVIYDCHSIRSWVPRLFEGMLPEFNIGTNCGVTCAPELGRAVADAAAESGRSVALNGRFKGGWTTRHYGTPETGVHAIQLEIAMRAYLQEPDFQANHPSSDWLADAADWPPLWNLTKAQPLRDDLARILDAVVTFAKGRT